MANPKHDQRYEYPKYAMHCLKIVEIAPDRETRIIQRQMAAEWLKLADGGPAKSSK